MVCRIAHDADAHRSRDTDQPHTFHSIACELAIDHDNYLNHGNWRNLAIFAISSVFGIRSTALAILALPASDTSLLLGADTNRKGLAVEEIVDLKFDAMMFTVNTQQSDLSEQKLLREEKLRAGLRRLRRRVYRKVGIEREKALICRLLASRFAADSTHGWLLRMLARSATHRVVKLRNLLYELPGTAISRLRRRFLLTSKCWYVLHAPRKLALLQLKYQRD